MSTGVSDQRMRGQGSQGNGPNKDQLNDHEDFSSWRAQSIQNSYASGVAQSNTASSTGAGDPYLSSYYGAASTSSSSSAFPPYHQLDHGGPWSSTPAAASSSGGNAAEMAFLSYGAAPPAHHPHHHHHDSYGIDGMFGSVQSGGGGFGGFHQQQAAYGGYDYSAWETRKVQQHPVPHYEDYYRPEHHHQSVYHSARLEEGPSVTVASQPAAMQLGGGGGVKQVEQGMQGLALGVGGGDMSKTTSLPASTAPASVVEQATVQHQPAQPAAKPKLTWASIASQPAKPQPAGNKKKSMVPPPMVTPRTPSTASASVVVASNSINHASQLDIGTWADGGKNGVLQQPPAVATLVQQQTAAVVAPPAVSPPQPANSGHPPQPRPAAASNPVQPVQQQPQGRPSSSGYANAAASSAPARATSSGPASTTPPKQQQSLAVSPQPASASSSSPVNSNPVLEELQSKHVYNPKEFDPTGALSRNARFFVIKSYSEDDIHRSIKYEIWCSTEHGNKRLDAAFREREGKGPVYLFFSVNGSGHFCGMAEMTSAVDMSSSLSVWSQDKWRGQFSVKWIYVKDVPNAALRHIRLENNENKPVTNSRDTQEVPPEKGRQVLKIIHTYRHATSIFDDFSHYEKRQAEEDQRKAQQRSSPVSPAGHHNDYDSERGGGHRERGGDYGRPEPRDHRPARNGGGYNDYNHRDRDGYRGGGGRDVRDRDRDRDYNGRGGPSTDRDRDRDRDRYIERDPPSFRGGSGRHPRDVGPSGGNMNRRH